MARPTIFDVAEVAGVSIKTVSRVVNNEPNVRESTRERVENAIAVLKYRPDQSARNLASQSSHLIGLIYDDPAAYENPSSGYILDLQQGALKGSKSALSELLIHPCDFRQKDVGVKLKAFIEETRLSGIILAAPLSNMPKIVRAIRATGTPFVRLSPGNDGSKEKSVATNDREVCAEMTRYLAGLGHKRIAFICGDPNHKAVAKRFPGYKDGIRDSGLEFSEQLVAYGNNSFDSGLSAAETLLAQDPRPTAIFAANDDMAAGVLRAATRLGIDVPGQLSIAGFDDTALAQQIDPPMTTVRQPLVEMARHAAEMLAEPNGNGAGDGENHEVVPATIVIRESTGPAPVD
jgi:LacI family transcriptional regulator